MAEHESLEETQRRLGLSTEPVTGTRVARQRMNRQYSPTPAPTVPPVNARGALRIAVAIGVIAAIGVVGYNVAQTLPQLGLASDAWTTYPGTYFEDSDYVLASDSLEATTEKGDALLAELQGQLAAYGFEWSVEYPSEAYRASNGYNGDSMLYNYSSETIIGAVQSDDPAARENIIRIFGEVMSMADSPNVVIDNDETDGDDAIERFGSDRRDAQALWSTWSYSEHFSGLQGDLSVFDATVPTAEQFDGDYWVPEDVAGTLVVRMQVSASYLLSEGDRAAFIAALEPYEGETKPEYRG
jgi:hypothetical protein